MASKRQQRKPTARQGVPAPQTNHKHRTIHNYKATVDSQATTFSKELKATQEESRKQVYHAEKEARTARRHQSTAEASASHFRAEKDILTKEVSVEHRKLMEAEKQLSTTQRELNVAEVLKTNAVKAQETAQQKIAILEVEKMVLQGALADADATISELLSKLDNSINKDDVPAFWLTTLELYNNDQIEEKDQTLLKHLASRMKNGRAAVTGV